MTHILRSKAPELVEARTVAPNVRKSHRKHPNTNSGFLRQIVALMEIELKGWWKGYEETASWHQCLT